MKNAGRTITADAARRRGGRRSVGEVLRATPAVAGRENPIENPNGNSKSALDRWDQHEIAAGTGGAPGDSRDPAPGDPAGRPTNILSWQVE